MTKASDSLPLVVLDGRTLNRPHVRGIGRYALQLLRRTDGDLRWLVLGDSPEFPLHVPACQHVQSSVFETRGYRFHAWEQLGVPLRTRRAAADVLFFPGTTASFWQPVPTVITVQDVIPWLNAGEELGAGLYRDRVLPHAFRRAAAIITPSRHSAGDLARLWPQLKDKISVIPHGVEDTFLTITAGTLPPSLREMGVAQPYLMYLGGEIPRKRLTWALDVWMDVGDPTVKLVVCGLPPAFQSDVRGRVPPEWRESLCFASFIPEQDMPALYANAVAVLYPTTYEGFGFPAIEAQACGSPVLFSASGSLCELVGPGAHVLAPDDAVGWRETCRTLLAQRRAVIRQHTEARRWAGQFSWAASARRHVELFQAVARRTSRRPAVGAAA